MRKLFVLLAVLLTVGAASAQKKADAKKDQPKRELPPPFKGGIDTMMQFFKDNLKVTPQIIKAKATGQAIIKLTVDEKGMISSIVVYYADDYLLTEPAIAALRKTNGKWVIPSEVKSYDFILQFSINYKPVATLKPATSKIILDYYLHHKPIIAKDQVPLNYATMLPTFELTYE